jgi:plastocyanin
MVAVGRDQHEGFGCPILLDPATAHDTPFRRGCLARPPARHFNVEVFRGRRKHMVRFSVCVIAALTVALGRPAGAQRVHEVRLEQSAGGGAFRFKPAQVTARPGEILEFRVENGGPYQIAFEPADLTPAGRQQLDQALGSRGGALRGPLLTATGDRFRITVPALPPGRYRFFSLLHLAYRMSGTLIVP